MENDEKLNFLDLMIHRDSYGNILTNWHRKPTYSGRVLNYLSNHPMQHKIAIIKNLTDKSIKLADKEFQPNNLKYINEILLLNNYPQSLISKHIKKRLFHLSSLNSSQNTDSDTNFNSRNLFKLPYVNENITNHIINFLKQYDLNIIFHIPFKLNKLIKLGKDKIKKEQHKNIVYSINCKDCDSKYIGQTGRLASTRIFEEHQKNYSRSEKNYNVISLHKKETSNQGYEHDFDFEEFEILHQESNLKKRELVELFYIKKHQKHALNVKTDLKNFSPPYEILLNQII